jgi:hypothetical protein
VETPSNSPISSDFHAQIEPNTPEKRYQIVTEIPPLALTLYIQNAKVGLLENERVSNGTDKTND